MAQIQKVTRLAQWVQPGPLAHLDHCLMGQVG
jgi:hypothetical protein